MQAELTKVMSPRQVIAASNAGSAVIAPQSVPRSRGSRASSVAISKASEAQVAITQLTK